MNCYSNYYYLIDLLFVLYFKFLKDLKRSMVQILFKSNNSKSLAEGYPIPVIAIKNTKCPRKVGKLYTLRKNEP